MADSRQIRIQSFAFVISACAALCLSVIFAQNLFNSQSACSASDPCADNRINPNTATAASLVRLPDVGLSMAEAIIQYRNNFTERNDRRAFEMLDDLQNVKGLGPAKVQRMKDFLKFE